MSIVCPCTDWGLTDSCEYCRAGNYNLCPDIKFAATPPYDGTLTKYFVLPHDMVVPLSDNISLEEGGIPYYDDTDR